MKGTINEIRTAGTLTIFKVQGDNNDYQYQTAKMADALAIGFEVEFETSNAPGREKKDGGFWPDNTWANKISIIGDAIGDAILGDSPPTSVIKYPHDPPLIPPEMPTIEAVKVPPTLPPVGEHSMVYTEIARKALEPTKDVLICRQTCIKAAGAVLAGTSDGLDPDKLVKYAKVLESYVLA